MFKNANFFITEFFRSLLGKQPADSITPKIATAIQKQEYFNSLNGYDESFTPPYLVVAYQMLNKNNEVFESSVYYLCVIAKNMPKYKKDILRILKNYSEEHKKEQERVNYINSQIAEHNLKKNNHK